VDLSAPSFSSHGEYWYNVHLVIVNEERWRETREELLDRLSSMIEGVAEKHGERLSRVAIVPDHIHLTMGCAIERSPEQIALSYLNNGAYACGMKAAFQFGYYVGTFGEYDRGAV
jgi:REP element-mobilizing transposase RayT